MILPAAVLWLGTAIPAYAGESGSADTLAVAEVTLTALGDDDSMCVESPLGSFAADAVRFAVGSDIAVVCGGNICANLPGGNISRESLERVFVRDCGLRSARVSPAELKELLERGVSHVTLAEDETMDLASSAYDGFPQVSGFTFQYDASAPVGQRVMYVTLTADGEEQTLDLSDEEPWIRLAAAESMFSEQDAVISADRTVPAEYSMVEAAVSYAASGGVVTPPSDGRIKMVGASSQWLFEYVPVAALFLAALLFAFLKPYREGLAAAHRPRRDD